MIESVKTSPRILLIDVDGVLTTGEVFVTSSGERSKAFNCRDSRAIREFVAMGWEVHLISTSDWGGVKEYTRNLGVFVHTGIDKTREAIHEITRGEPYVAVGDDVFDLEMLKGAEKAYCPSDADDYAKQKVHELRSGMCLFTAGGKGVIAELVRRFNPNW